MGKALLNKYPINKAKIKCGPITQKKTATLKKHGISIGKIAVI